MPEDEQSHEAPSLTAAPSQEDTAKAQAGVPSKRERIYAPSLGAELRQGEILTDLPELRLNVEAFIATGAPKLDIDIHPYAIVVSQDCDLVTDYYAHRSGEPAEEKILRSIIFCAMTTADLFRGRPDVNKDIWRRAITNKNERYHLLEAVPSEGDALGVGLPALAIDFKVYFSIPRAEAYHRLASEAKRRCYLLSPYLEHFATRFSYFLSRVALPTDHSIKQ